MDIIHTPDKSYEMERLWLDLHLQRLHIKYQMKGVGFLKASYFSINVRFDVVEVRTSLFSTLLKIWYCLGRQHLLCQC
jgi:hypothetical protein